MVPKEVARLFTAANLKAILGRLLGMVSSSHAANMDFKRPT
jgi:hypothetical protein